MPEVAIRADRLGKRYRVGERERYQALRDVLTRAVTAPFRSRERRATDYLWAVRDLSFDMAPGEVVGLIGRNGAGKTTLLKILSRVTRPTTGYAEVHGRIGSLLEVGTGFHPELTGRENVFLSGAILGMAKRDIVRKFDAIVAFADIERFLDTPLKHFSTGMQMRLAFAVAAHLEPEIMLVDEVLAVGDLEFQKKCLGKMEDVSRSGRTIIFVSHQMNQIRRLCERAIWVDGGTIRRDGPAKEVVNEYEASSLSADREEIERTPGTVVFRSWQVGNTQSNLMDLDRLSGPALIRFDAHVKEEIGKGLMIVALRTPENVILWSGMYPGLQLKPGPWEFALSFDQLPLNPGIYTWELRIFDGHVWREHTLAPELSIVSKQDADVFGNLRGPLSLRAVLDLSSQTQPLGDSR